MFYQHHLIPADALQRLYIPSKKAFSSHLPTDIKMLKKRQKNMNEISAFHKI
jgi:hypothetical protein